ncbi:carbohydrate porin [Sphingomonas sp.]|uniref:carbohydrate porin n=1 Tax=Sphingomonas sp. TaxID=28214 RepID=UPI001B0EE09B|nr:carbohydrate porin [Sphingomonas sp.]MBO9711371.1 carbohydrate porin [Sphingomonas sp.]
MRICRIIAVSLLGFVASPALAEDDDKPIELAAVETMDAIATSAPAGKARAYWLNNLDLTADADLDKLAGWQGGSVHVYVLDNVGGRPNDTAATLQGIDNIEVAHAHLRLFEAWVEQKIGRTSVRVGLYDLNSEFYSNDSAGLLIAPAFGVGSEIAATGPNGPSIFPSTALAVRVDTQVGKAGYVRAALLGAKAGTLGDPGGVDFHFRNGGLAIVEAGFQGDAGKLGVGGWTYTDRQDDVREVDGLGDPIQRHAHGAYLIAEKPLNDPDKPRAAAAFVRLGISDGQTTPFKGGWQAGVLVTKLWESRPDSQLSFGMNQGYVASGYRANLRDGGVRAARAETAFELTYSDKPAKWLTLQPDLQLVLAPGGDRGARPMVAGGIRITIEP